MSKTLNKVNYDKKEKTYYLYRVNARQTEVSSLVSIQAFAVVLTSTFHRDPSKHRIYVRLDKLLPLIFTELLTKV